MAFAAALAASATPAAAHAPPLAARVLSSGDGAEEVIVTNRGLVFHDPQTGSARLLCNEALRITTFELPSAALLGDGGLLVASSSGLRLTRDRGCTWFDVGQMEYTNTPALAADPNDSDTVVVASYGSAAPGLRVTHDGGASWSLSYPTEEEDFVFSLRVAEADSATLYATVATYAPGAPPVHALLGTRDGGASWQRSALPVSERDYAAKIAAIHPGDASTLVVYTIANSPGLDDSRLLVSDDGGATFRVALERPEIRGAAYGSGRLWVAARDGLYAGDAELTTFTRSSVASELGCVFERSGSLFACGHYAGLTSLEPGIGVSSDGGARFEPWLDFRAVDAAVECPAGSLTAALCASPWRDWELEMSGQLPRPASSALGPLASAAAADDGALGAPAVASAATAGVEPALPPAADATMASPAGELAPGAGAGASCALGAGASGTTWRAGGAVLALVAAAWLTRRACGRARAPGRRRGKLR